MRNFKSVGAANCQFFIFIHKYTVESKITGFLIYFTNFVRKWKWKQQKSKSKILRIFKNELLKTIICSNKLFSLADKISSALGRRSLNEKLIKRFSLLAGIANAPTYSLKEIVEPPFLEKKVCWKAGGFLLQRRKYGRFGLSLQLGWVLITTNESDPGFKAINR